MKPAPILAICLALCSAAYAGEKSTPPVVGPVPQSRPDKPSTGEPPVTAPDPLTPKDGTQPDTKPVPELNPATPEPDAAPAGNAVETEKQPAPPPMPAPPPEKEDPQAYAACMGSLKKAGAVFTETAPIDDGGGCGIDKPVTVSEILPGITLEPEATTRCETMLALSRWAKGAVIPAAELAFGAGRDIVSFHQATSYACRNRNSAGTGKISEHARGNGIDISGFTFSDKSTFDIKPRDKDGTMEGAFQRTIIASGCLYFSTVLGTESDAAHQTHIHLDVLKRNGGYRYCW